MKGFAACLADLKDPGPGNPARNNMLEMLLVTPALMLTGGEDCADMARFAETKIDLLCGFLEHKHGVPQPRYYQPIVAPAGSRACGGG